jgi:DNA damage-binding protein 1
LLTVRSISVDSEVTVVAILTRTDQSSPVIAVGTWANEILIYTLDSIKTSAEPLLRISESVFAKSLILKSSPATGTDLQLLAGLSDGSLITYDIDASEDGYSTTGRKASSLGNQPLALHPIQGSTTSGDEKLLAIGISDRMSILFENRDRVEFSSVSLPGIVAASAVEIGDEGDCLVLATATGLTITKVSGLKKLHIQTMDTGHRSSHKLAWMPDYKILAAGAVERRIDQATGDIWEQSYIEIRDQAALNRE